MLTGSFVDIKGFEVGMEVLELRRIAVVLHKLQPRRIVSIEEFILHAGRHGLLDFRNYYMLFNQLILIEITEESIPFILAFLCFLILPVEYFRLVQGIQTLYKFKLSHFPSLSK